VAWVGLSGDLNPAPESGRSPRAVSPRTRRNSHDPGPPPVQVLGRGRLGPGRLDRRRGSRRRRPYSLDKVKWLSNSVTRWGRARPLVRSARGRSPRRSCSASRSSFSPS